MQKQKATGFILCLLALSLMSCARNGQSHLANDPCLMFEPVYLHEGDVIAPETGKPILANNNTGHELCQWPYAQKQVESTSDNLSINSQHNL